ncbi:unnamed protein product [marine sediment metagenome]|uniref:Uncharacterized protein n=1 Tax=marine sediment metagenome TaxID=412755 RepID=X0TCV5_9ZZZZ
MTEHELQIKIEAVIWSEGMEWKMDIEYFEDIGWGPFLILSEKLEADDETI